MKADWGSSYRLVAAEKWKLQSAAMGRGVTEALVKYAQPSLGMRVLDLASGTGEPAISLAGLVGPKGMVTALDLSAELLKIASTRAHQRRLPNLSLCQGDAHRLPFRDQTFDLASCRFGVMFFAQVDVAFAELHRVLQPGGRACLAAWGPFEQPYWQSTIGIVVKHLGGAPLDLHGQDPFCFDEPARLQAALSRAGFRQTESFRQNVPWTWFGTADEVWHYVQAVSTPFRPLLECVPQSKWPLINAEVHSAVASYIQGDRIEFGAEIVLASGKRT
ncbi:MAG: class I SAM-dependent methyltransferase [Acidobacteria bacterium]|nr:class I SAM-dependent methyltransferase [Acidobacteriota bacterium]